MTKSTIHSLETEKKELENKRNMLDLKFTSNYKKLFNDSCLTAFNKSGADALKYFVMDVIPKDDFEHGAISRLDAEIENCANKQSHQKQILDKEINAIHRLQKELNYS